MNFLIAALIIWVLFGFFSLLSDSNPKMASYLGAFGAVLGCFMAAFPVLKVLSGSAAMESKLFQFMPDGHFILYLDGLSVIFLLPILILGATTAIYGVPYLRAYWGRRSMGVHWLCFCLLLATMVLVVLARNGLLLLLSWEGMALSSYFLVIFENDKKEVRMAGWRYLVASHLGTAFLLVLFAVMKHQSGSMDFSAWNIPHSYAGVLFVFAVIGFGTKAGIIPLHAWLPDAHPAAPSHVSALMSGAMIKTGIYGILRLLIFLGPPAPWWGYLLIIIALLSGVLGVLFALAQHDLKRLLAYHSVENIGIILLGIGVAVLGMSYHLTSLVVLGFTGGILHVLNHALFKGLLFMSAGSVYHSTGTREIDHLGGLLKKMPYTGIMFLIASAAICALPPFNGFISEFFIYFGHYQVIAQSNNLYVLLPILLGIAGLALIGGLAIACFTKAFGIVFLGNARTELKRPVQENGPLMWMPMLALAAGCLWIGLFPRAVIYRLIPCVQIVSGLDYENIISILSPVTLSLSAIATVAIALLILCVLIALFRWVLLKRNTVRQAETWGCGYEHPTSRIQYTASSFAQPITNSLSSVLQTIEDEKPIQTFFPSTASFYSHTPDFFVRYFFTPLFKGAAGISHSLLKLQSGSIHLYIFYIFMTLVLLLLWSVV